MAKARTQKPRFANKKTWILALDPFASFDFKPIVQFAEQMAEQSVVRLEAVYILAPASLNWTGEFSGPWVKKYKPIAEAKLNEVLDDSEISRQVVPCRKAGLRESVHGLLKFAKKKRAERILISTHARHGLDRFTLGSFAEALIVESKIPVMVTNPLRTIPHTVRKILVPTDLSKESEKFILEVGDEARRLGAEIVLFNKQTDPIDPIIQQGIYSLGGGWVSVQSYLDEEIERRTDQLKRLEARLRRIGVPVSHVLDSSPQDLVESIDQTARDTGADLVSLRTHAGKWESALLGSVARGLVRQSSIPVLVRR